MTSRLDYCNSLYYGINQSSMERLQLVQNAAARLLTGTRKFQHITPILTTLQWLPVKLKSLTLVFKALHNLAPIYLTELLQTHKSVRPLRSRFLGTLSMPRSRLKHRGDQAFVIVGPTLWMNEWSIYIALSYVLLYTQSALQSCGGVLSSTTTSVQHPLGWCDGSHRTTAPVRSPHTSYRWRGERDIEPIKWMGIIRRPWLTRASGGNLARTPGLHPYSLREVPWDF